MDWKTIIWRGGLLLLIILLISYFCDGWSAFPSGLVAWGTILLAYATWLSVKNSNERENQRRVDGVNRERRQRDISELDNIKNWVLRISACSGLLNTLVWPGLSADNEKARGYLQAEYINMGRNFDNWLADGLYIARMASAFEGSLHEVVLKLMGEISEHIRLIGVCVTLINNKNAEGFGVANSELTNHSPKVASSVDEVFKVIAELRFKALDI